VVKGRPVRKKRAVPGGKGEPLEAGLAWKISIRQKMIGRGGAEAISVKGVGKKRKALWARQNTQRR